jgi:hypothetical protein
MLVARQSTARTVTVGPVLDADGVAVTTAVVGDFKLKKNGAASAALNASATLTHDVTGHYTLALTASDLDTVGQAEVVIDKTTDACPVKEITVLEEAVYDAFYAASAVGYVANAPVTLADVAHGGAAAVLTLERVVVASATTDEPAVKLTGDGTGAGLHCAGAAGSNAAGIYAVGGSNAGDGIHAHGGLAGDGLHAQGTGSGGRGIHAQGGNLGGSGIHANGNAAGASGVTFEGGTNAHGLSLTGVGSGNDLHLATPSTNMPIPTAAEVSDKILGRSVAGGADGGRTVSEYLQGYTNKVVQSADGLTFTLYASDDLTVLQTFDATRLATTVGGLRSVTPD